MSIVVEAWTTEAVNELLHLTLHEYMKNNYINAQIMLHHADESDQTVTLIDCMIINLLHDIMYNHPPRLL